MLVSATRSGSGTIYAQVFGQCGVRASSLAACLSGTVVERRLVNLPAGTYYVVVETLSSTAGDLEVTVTTTDPADRSPMEETRAFGM